MRSLWRPLYPVAPRAGPDARTEAQRRAPAPMMATHKPSGRVLAYAADFRQLAQRYPSLACRHGRRHVRGCGRVHWQRAMPRPKQQTATPGRKTQPVFPLEPRQSGHRPVARSGARRVAESRQDLRRLGPISRESDGAAFPPLRSRYIRPAAARRARLGLDTDRRQQTVPRQGHRLPARGTRTAMSNRIVTSTTVTSARRRGERRSSP